MKLTCKQCGKEFELSESEINFYKSKNLHIPKRCKDCRQENKQKKSGRVQEYGTPDMKNKYQVLSNSNGAGNSRNSRNSKLVYAVLIIAIILAVGGIILTNIDFSGGYVVSNEPVYDSTDYVPEEIHREPESVPEEAEDEPETSLENIQNELENPIENIQTEPEVDVDNVQSESESLAELIQGEIDDSANQEQENVISVPQYRFRNSEFLTEHYEKHGKEMGFSSKEEYQAAASAVVTNADALHKIEAEDNDDVYYLEASNEFVIVSTDGFIRTYFKPNDGIAYFNRQ